MKMVYNVQAALIYKKSKETMIILRIYKTVHTWPAKKPCSFVLPARYCSTCFGFSASTLSIIFSISPGSVICKVSLMQDVNKLTKLQTRLISQVSSMVTLKCTNIYKTAQCFFSWVLFFFKSVVRNATYVTWNRVLISILVRVQVSDTSKYAIFTPKMKCLSVMPMFKH